MRKFLPPRGQGEVATLNACTPICTFIYTENVDLI